MAHSRKEKNEERPRFCNRKDILNLWIQHQKMGFGPFSLVLALFFLAPLFLLLVRVGAIIFRRGGFYD
jgi:hypothetical protein